jgi:hypothetical protein
MLGVRGLVRITLAVIAEEMPKKLRIRLKLNHKSLECFWQVLRLCVVPAFFQLSV